MHPIHLHHEKSKGGLFWLLCSLFGKKQRPEFEAMQNDALANASDSTIVAVSRAEAPDDAEPQQPTQPQPPPHHLKIRSLQMQLCAMSLKRKNYTSRPCKWYYPSPPF